MRWWFEHDEGFRFVLNIHKWYRKSTQRERDMYANGAASEARKKLTPPSQPSQIPPPPPPSQPSPQVAAEISSATDRQTEHIKQQRAGIYKLEERKPAGKGVVEHLFEVKVGA